MRDKKEDYETMKKRIKSWYVTTWLRSDQTISEWFDWQWLVNEIQKF